MAAGIGVASMAANATGAVATEGGKRAAPTSVSYTHLTLPTKA